ncbi:HET-domain-containing protein [Hyaloscypha hepaticicola]|uniref:HET-domain-containing protein n=1 Tax=Hyaloscypha hepaticicola TaxID=2082293 RepID=A0A2J6Q5D1_9HELO|nr:HET-domain-containing protein [Hyaloscypha hepaticicola]
MEIDGELCSRCEPMFSTLENLTNLKYRHGSQGYRHYKRRELMESASKGCKLCKILWSETRSSWRDGNDQQLLFRAHSDYFVTHEQSGYDMHPFFNAGKDLFINLSLLSANDGHERYITTFILITAADNSAAKYIEARPIPNDLSDRQTQSQIQTWLRDCQENHQCSEEMAVPKLPTRVLDLSNSKSQPRLHISATNERSHYACLSYCWGGPQEVLTTKANLHEYAKRLPVDRLPKTLQDAISVSKTLGLRFLWIDALCIIQNSDEDKAVEINKMGSIYRDATVTIFAASASRVGDGFLQHRSSDEGGVLLPFYVSDSSQGTVTLLLQESPYTPNEPLDSRAWVVQETLLSRRRLIYGTKELLWKCQEDDYQTVTVSPRSYDMLVTSLPGDIFSPIQDSLVKRQKETDIPRAQSWSIIVKNFTSRGMTNREDRLPAIGGVAAELQKLWKDEYIIGTWRSTLAKHLMWYRLKSHPSASLPRPVEYRSPT